MIMFNLCEPNKCGNLLWADMDNLPKNIIPYVPSIIEDIKLGIKYDDGYFVNLKKEKD